MDAFRRSAIRLARGAVRCCRHPPPPAAPGGLRSSSKFLLFHPAQCVSSEAAPLEAEAAKESTEDTSEEEEAAAATAAGAAAATKAAKANEASSSTVEKQAPEDEVLSTDAAVHPSASFSREKSLVEVLLQHGLRYIRPLGRGTFGRVVLARTGTQASDPLTAVKIARSSGGFTFSEAREAEAHLKLLADFLATLPVGFVKEELGRKVLPNLEEQVRLRSPVAGEYRLFEGQMVRRAEAEQVIWSRLQHPFISNFLYSFKHDSQFYLVSEYSSGGTLKEVLAIHGGKLELAATQYYAAQMSLALAYLQSERIAHRDVKPDNILVDAHGNLALNDFGLATKVKTGLTQFCGTAEYLPPEVLMQGSWDARPLDWWALGVMIFEMLAGYNPFAGESAQDCFNAIITLRTAADSFYPDDMDPAAVDLIKQLLLMDPGSRLCAPVGGGLKWRVQVHT
eukprot:INCI16204.3.p1 GENE.INCI16204.3~~INCI16204.3.p1  ORF type:complete len:452 (-),score=84.56 INCI16204.3:1090-2445(-)